MGRRLITFRSPSRYPGILYDFTAEKHFTGANWIDGKPIFREVFTFIDVPNATIAAVGNVPDVDTWTNLYGVWVQASKIVQMGFSTVNENISITIDPLTGDVELQPQTMSSINNGHVIVEYTEQ